MDNSNNVNPYINTIPKSLYDYNSQFNELEYKRFTELMIASNVMFVNKTPITSQVQSVEDFMYAIDVQRINDIKNCVKLLKGLAVFRQQCDHDQLILIKYGALEIHTLRSISYYDYQNEAFNIAIDENNTTVLQLTLLKQFGCDLYNNFKLFLNSLYRLYDMDDNILNLITVIILFNPNRPNLKHQETIKLEQKVYMHLLKRYLTMKYQNDCESSKRYLQLINTLLDLNFYDKRYKESSMSRPTLPALIHEIIVE
ncbi:nuclear hormone receptor HR96-like [Oppia nitens]|uniref:nuclear hormone receptor HR96-like n=1 Tax=Oppia nitens TaxID=1686743 RepID=UPI0023DBABEB|nr:nuclear hormone receptor HR96-like [Oppia nitens]